MWFKIALPQAKRRLTTFVPRKAAVQLTEPARRTFRQLLAQSEADGLRLMYHQSQTGEPRMVFGFDLVRESDLNPMDEGVSLEVNEDQTPKSPEDAQNDGLKKLYIHQDAFLKVLGATVDVDPDTLMPVLYDREGNKMDPNA